MPPSMDEPILPQIQDRSSLPYSTFLHNANQSAPLPEHFDFDAYASSPPNLDIGKSPLRFRLRNNCAFEISNENSICQTSMAELDVLRRTDVGPPLKAMWAIAPEDLSEMVADEKVVEAVGPVPFQSRVQISRLRRLGEENREEKRNVRSKPRHLQGALIVPVIIRTERLKTEATHEVLPK